jgi:HK97 gp10 family phage protein
MAKISFKGIEQYTNVLRSFSESTDAICGKAVYNGAAVVADEIKKNLEELPVDNGYGTEKDKIDAINKKSKLDLIESFGITPLKKENGYLEVKIGFDGYGSVKTATYPNGIPNQMVARAVETGTSFRQKHPFVRPAISKTKNTAVQAMEETVKQECENKFK